MTIFSIPWKKSSEILLFHIPEILPKFPQFHPPMEGDLVVYKLLWYEYEPSDTLATHIMTMHVWLIT